MTDITTKFCAGKYCRMLRIFGVTLVVATITLSTTIGCGDGRARRVPVEGVVTIDGEPLQFGSITFMPAAGSPKDARAGGASVNSEGRFQVSSYSQNDGLMMGKYSVTVLATELIDNRSQRWHAPMEYSKMADSKLSVEISGATDEVKFELTWDEDSKHSAPFVEKF